MSMNIESEIVELSSNSGLVCYFHCCTDALKV